MTLAAYLSSVITSNNRLLLFVTRVTLSYQRIDTKPDDLAAHLSSIISNYTTLLLSVTNVSHQATTAGPESMMTLNRISYNVQKRTSFATAPDSVDSGNRQFAVETGEL